MKSFRKGMLDGIPIALGYLAVSFSFGIMGTKYGISIFQTVLISMTNMTSAGQFAGIEIIAAAGSYLEMFVTQLVINLRYALMSIALSQKVDKSFSKPVRALLGFAVTDEIFGVAISRNEDINKSYFLGLAVLPYLGWACGTLLGAISGDILPARVSAALGIALYGMFVAILVPPMKKRRPVLFVVVVACVLSIILKYQPWFTITTGFSVIICAIVSSTLGALLFPVKGEDEHEG